LLVVAHRGLVDSYVTACRRAGLKLEGIDLEAFGILRALAVPSPGLEANPEAALVVVSVGNDRSTIAVSHGSLCQVTRPRGWGGPDLDVALARALDRTPVEGEPIKRTLSLLDEQRTDGLDDDRHEKARAALRRGVETFARDLVASLTFYQNQPGSLSIGEIALAGGTAQLPGLADELQRLI